MFICNICNCNIGKGQCIYIVECNHVFHSSCFSPLLDSVWFNLNCPTCNKKIRKNRTKLLMMPMDN